MLKAPNANPVIHKEKRCQPGFPQLLSQPHIVVYFMSFQTLASSICVFHNNYYYY